MAVRREAFPGAQPDLLGALGPAFDVLDLDDPQYAPQEDFAAYATCRLLAETDPGYGPRPTRLRSIVAGCLGAGTLLLAIGLIQATGLA